MKAVIIAAGESTRTEPITADTPKPIIKIANKEIIFRNMENASPLVDGFVIVVGFRKEVIEERVGNSFDGKPVQYVEQKERLGTGHALMQAEKHVDGKIMVIMGDDLYGKDDMKRCAKHENCVLGKEVDDPGKFGVFLLKDGKVTDIIEKSPNPPSNLANTAFYILSDSIFDELRNARRSERGEYELTDGVKSLAGKTDVFCEKVRDYWIPVGYPWHLINANEFILSRMKDALNSGVVEDGAVIKGSVSIGKGTVIRSGSYIEGPVVIGEDCDIGPNCYIRPCTSIGNRCRIGNAVEVKNCVIMDRVRIGHLSYFGDSVICPDANIGAGTVAANLRHDGTNVRTMVKGKLEDTGRRKFGTVIGRGASTGIKTSIYPGRKIWPGKWTEPSSIVKEDVR
ncbi:MAG: glucose-1-phosphate thymidylyltransferase [Candidatus Aenigmatarchaeota archaeon]|nr:MAG: glucose-1-phosphate thymidylyltransferase [Candidatus Aenigmarchaeota archaeon]